MPRESSETLSVEEGKRVLHTESQAPIPFVFTFFYRILPLVISDQILSSLVGRAFPFDFLTCLFIQN